MVCTFFGHRDTPYNIKEKLKSVIIELIENKNVNTFYMGDNGAFDRMAREILKELKNKYEINYYVVMAYIPKKSEHEDYGDTVYFDELNIKPYKCRIVERNKIILRKSDVVVTHVTRIVGGAAEFKKMAEKKGKTVINVI